MRSIFLALLCILGAGLLSGKEKRPATYTIPLPPKPDFSAVDWLVGDWTGKTTGRSPQGEIRLSVSYGLDKRFMIFREEISFSSTKTAPPSKESWMGILGASRDGAAFILRTFSSMGFITRYRVTQEGGEIRFSSEGGDDPPPGWVFRRVVERSGDAEFDEKVQAAPPDKPFFDYYTARLVRTPHP